MPILNRPNISYMWIVCRYPETKFVMNKYNFFVNLFSYIHYLQNALILANNVFVQVIFIVQTLSGLQSTTFMPSYNYVIAAIGMLWVKRE